MVISVTIYTVRAKVANALAAGGSAPMPEQRYGFMLQHGFMDLAGHMWEVLYIDPAFHRLAAFRG